MQRPFGFCSFGGSSSAGVTQQRATSQGKGSEGYEERRTKRVKKRRRLKEEENEPRSDDSVPANRLAALKFLSVLNTHVRWSRTSDRLTAKLRDPVYDYFHAPRLGNGFIDVSAPEQQALRSFNNHEESERRRRRRRPPRARRDVVARPCAVEKYQPIMAVTEKYVKTS